MTTRVLAYCDFRSSQVPGAKVAIRPKKGPKRPESHHQDTENIDETTNKGSNHPKMDGFFRFFPLLPFIPEPTESREWRGFSRDAAGGQN